MPNKQLCHYRFSSETLARIEHEAEKTGLTATRVIENAILRRGAKQLSPPIRELVEEKMRAKKWTFNHVIEWAVMRAVRSEEQEIFASRTPEKK